MTRPDKAALAGDYRRAAALIVHHGTHSLDGLNAVLEEAGAADRVSELILAVLGLYGEIVPELRTDAGMSLMSAHVMRLAGMEEQ